MVVTDTDTGEVLAVVGNRKTDEPGSFNRAMQAQRPVGSLLKPFVYLLALAQPDRYSLASWVDDSPVEVTQPNGKAVAAEEFRRQVARHGHADLGAGALLQPGHGARRHGSRARSPVRTDEGARPA